MNCKLPIGFDEGVSFIPITNLTINMKNVAKLIPSFLVKRCPKSGKIVRFRFDNVYAKIGFPLFGILAIIWFLMRVIPKPSRAAYPCQQVAVGLGSAFLVYLFGFWTSLTIYDKIRNKINKPVALGYLAVLAVVATVGYGIAKNATPGFISNFMPPEGRNNPIGEAKGIFPGRVVWTQDFDATSWDGKTGTWWGDNNTSQVVTDKMISETLKNVTGEKTDKESWQKLFEYSNLHAGSGKKGYKKGEKILIKINMNPVGKLDAEWLDKGYPSPQMLNSLVKQLVEVASVSCEDIVISDPSRFINGPIVEKIRGNKSKGFENIVFEVKEAPNFAGFRSAEPDSSASALVWFVMPDGSKYKMCFPKSFSEATYIINYTVVRPHRVFGITSAAKNHFGSVWDFKQKAFNPSTLHAFALWDYPTPNKMNDAHSAPVLLGHHITSSKTILYLADGLYTAISQTGSVKRMSTFNNDWFSSLLMSQDPVALESVVYDFIASEPNLVSGNPSFNGNQDNQFHECALANNPPSGTKYDPENDGTGLTSLGVHEHWNNAKDRLYSRNMGKNIGIELITIRN